MFDLFRRTLHPERYQGHGRKPPYFEGWYYKLVDAAERCAYAIIPGLFLHDDPAQSHAFVQILDGGTGRVSYHTYPQQAFRAARDDFEVYVGPNRFTAESISMQLDVPERTVLGELHFTGLTPWPVTLRSPGIMGWYAWVPLMECYHGVVSLDHGIQGSLHIDGRPTDFSGGRGYIEKDWGQAFPSAWIWFQSNHFDQPRTSLTASVAVIPWLRRSFVGFIVGLWQGSHLYRFATYTGAKQEKLYVSDTHVDWTLRNRHHRLELLVERRKGAPLRGPSGTDMGRPVPESLQASVQVRLSRLDGGQTLFQGIGRQAGLEVVGQVESLA